MDFPDGYRHVVIAFAPIEHRRAVRRVLRVSAVEKIGSDARVSFPSVAGYVYRIEMKDDMTLPTWTLLADQIPGTGGVIQITDPGAATLPKRFYRIVVLP